MLGLGAARRVYLATGPTDLRRGYNGLYAQVKNVLGSEPLNGDVYVFCNRRREALKAFFWDGSGMCLFGKRLEQGRFRWPATGERTVALTAAELHALLAGLDLAGAKRRPWWRREVA